MYREKVEVELAMSNSAYVFLVNTKPADHKLLGIRLGRRRRTGHVGLRRNTINTIIQGCVMQEIEISKKKKKKAVIYCRKLTIAQTYNF